jgi:cytochrome P450
MNHVRQISSVTATSAARDQGDKLSDSELFDQIFGICGASLSATSRAAGGALYLLYTIAAYPDW